MIYIIFVRWVSNQIQKKTFYSHILYASVAILRRTKKKKQIYIHFSSMDLFGLIFGEWFLRAIYILRTHIYWNFHSPYCVCAISVGVCFLLIISIDFIYMKTASMWWFFFACFFSRKWFHYLVSVSKIEFAALFA